MEQPLVGFHVVSVHSMPVLAMSNYLEEMFNSKVI
jgi:hypothetical protein